MRLGFRGSGCGCCILGPYREILELSHDPSTSLRVLPPFDWEAKQFVSMRGKPQFHQSDAGHVKPSTWGWEFRVGVFGLGFTG